MKKPEKSEVLLNHVFVKNRIAERGLKQWWLAEQIGVDRKTVVRWLQGAVRSIRTENAVALASVLGCGVEELILQNEADQLATPDDQKSAAAVLASNQTLIENLGPIGEWNVIETLLKAALVPNLPLDVLGELYNRLTVAFWRQSKIDQAASYNKKAEEIALRSGDKTVLAGALLSKALIFSWRGQTSRSIETYKECLALENYLPPRTVGSTLSNLGAVLYEAGDLNAGQDYVERSISVFDEDGTATNLSIAYCHLARIALQKSEIERAEATCTKSVEYAMKDDYRRGVQMGKLVLAEIRAHQGRSDEAVQLAELGLAGFRELGIHEGLNYESAGRVYRLSGDLGMAEALLREGLRFAKEFPLEEAGLHFELALVLKQGRPTAEEALKSAKKAIDLYRRVEAPQKATSVVIAFDIEDRS